MNNKLFSRQSGVLMPIFSLPSKYGIGDFGKESYLFIDLLKGANQKLWQILPLVQTESGNSPYSTMCSDSFSPYYISPELLFEQGLITKEELNLAFCNKTRIDYKLLKAVRYKLLERAFCRFDKQNQEFAEFVSTKQCLDYALFMAIKETNSYKPFYEWEEGLKNAKASRLSQFLIEKKERVAFYQFLQFMARSQWFDLKKYANKNGIQIIGDLPLYVAHDSTDVWKNNKLFKLDKNLLPTSVAGVPPDYFCESGQLWGNPVYDYLEHKKDNFSWWVSRLEKALKIYDIVRIDHFRALDRYYEIDANSKNAKAGKWIKVPSKELFEAINKKVDKNRIIAEDLGIIDDGVKALIKSLGYSGMKVLSFAFNGDKDNPYMPQNINENSICYTGTHDNNTLRGFIKCLNNDERKTLINGVKNSLKELDIDINIDDDLSIIRAIIMLGVKSKAKMFIVPMQDLLFLDSDYRINTPGVVKESNWSVKFNKDQICEDAFLEIKNFTKKYDR